MLSRLGGFLELVPLPLQMWYGPKIHRRKKLSPSDIIHSLVWSSQFREAITATKGLTIAEQESISLVIKNCKKKLWESELSIAALEEMKDVAFIVEQALSSSSDTAIVKNLRVDALALYRSVCRLALSRIRTAQLGASLVIAGTIGKSSKAIAEAIALRLIKLGMYELLCKHLSQDPTFPRFVEDFLPMSPDILASHLARSADIAALSLLSSVIIGESSFNVTFLCSNKFLFQFCLRCTSICFRL